MPEDEKPEFQQFDLQPEVENPTPTLYQLSKHGAEIALSLTKKYPPAACLAVLLISVKAISTLIELSLGERAEKVKKDAQDIADVVDVKKQDFLGIG